MNEGVEGVEGVRSQNVGFRAHCTCLGFAAVVNWPNAAFTCWPFAAVVFTVVHWVSLKVFDARLGSSERILQVGLDLSLEILLSVFRPCGGTTCRADFPAVILLSPAGRHRGGGILANVNGAPTTQRRGPPKRNGTTKLIVIACPACVSVPPTNATYVAKTSNPGNE